MIRFSSSKIEPALRFSKESETLRASPLVRRRFALKNGRGVKQADADPGGRRFHQYYAHRVLETLWHISQAPTGTYLRPSTTRIDSRSTCDIYFGRRLGSVVHIGSSVAMPRTWFARNGIRNRTGERLESPPHPVNTACSRQTALHLKFGILQYRGVTLSGIGTQSFDVKHQRPMDGHTRPGSSRQTSRRTDLKTSNHRVHCQGDIAWGDSSAVGP